MRLIPSDPDVETIVGRIQSGDLDLQPEFQRGEVWSKLKKQRLIDSILRDWHVPPIHVIENSKSNKHEVLDGQQRLAAIRDFVAGVFPVDGHVEPFDAGIESIDGKYYSQLPKEWQRRFNQFTIRLIRVVDYRPSEPAEIFFRLNQPTSLTGAEQRNAFFGPVRQQIKNLVEALLEGGADKEFIGFSNLRMAYDDVLARTAIAVERKSLAEKITSSDLADLYRSETPISETTIALLRYSISAFRSAGPYVGQLPKFNKATLFSWLMFLVRARLSDYSCLTPTEFGAYLEFFETSRVTVVRDIQYSSRIALGDIPVPVLLSVYDNRASARVADVSSVILRDAILWLMFEDFARSRPDLQRPTEVRIGRVHAAFTTKAKWIDNDDIIAKHLIAQGWGKLE